VVVTSAETVTLLFFASATWKSLRASGLGWLAARAPYVNWDLDDMVDGGVGGVMKVVNIGARGAYSMVNRGVSRKYCSLSQEELTQIDPNPSNSQE